MRNVIIRPDEKAPPPKRRGYPFAGAPPPPSNLVAYQTRRKMFEEEPDPFFKRKPNLAFLYSGSIVVVPLATFLRKSSVKPFEEEFPNFSRHVPWNPQFQQPVLVILSDGPGSGQLGIPTLVGGQQRLQILVAGSEVTDPAQTYSALTYGLGNGVGAQPVRIYSQTIGRGTATFDIYDPGATLAIELGQTVLIQENGTRLFVGCISILTPELFEGATSGANLFLVWHVTAVDKSGIFDHRVVLAPFYAAGTDAADVIRDLFTNPAACNPPLSQEGITLNNLPASLGPLSTDIVMNKWTVTQLINAVVTDVAGVWWIDTTSDLNVQLIPNIGSAPFSLSMTSGNFRKAGNVASLVDYRNKEYVVSDRVVEPDNAVPGIVGTPTVETWTLPQALANALGYLPLSIVTNLPMLKVTGLKVNGVSQPVYIGTQFPFINLRHVWWYFPQTNFLIPPNAQNQNVFPDPAQTSPDPNSGDVVQISYLAPTQSAGVVINDPLAPTFGTCGSGVYEHVEQVKGITKQSDIAAIATALLARSGLVPKVLRFETDYGYLFVGQKLHVDLPLLDLGNTDLMITTVDGTALDGTLGQTTPPVSRFRWQITATNTQDLGNAIAWFERFVARTQNGIPLPRLRAYNWVLAPGGSLAGGVLSSTPQDVLETGQVFKAAVQFTNPPVDQTVTIDIISAAQGSILGGPQVLSVAANSTTLAFITKFTNDPAPFYLYQGDNLTVSITYSVTGPNPVNAANGKLTLQVTY